MKQNIIGESFSTTHGLKVRLNPEYFFHKYVNENTDENKVKEKISATSASIETRILIPTMLKWFWTMIVLCFGIGIELVPYVLITAGIYLFGWIVSLLPLSSYISLIRVLFFPLNFIFSIITGIFMYAPYVIAIITAIITKRYDILITFLIVSLIFPIIFDFLTVNFILVKISLKRYGFPFGYAEIIAFDAIYQTLLAPAPSLHRFIKEYSDVESYCNYISNIQQQN